MGYQFLFLNKSREATEVGIKSPGHQDPDTGGALTTRSDPRTQGVISEEAFAVPSCH